MLFALLFFFLLLSLFLSLFFFLFLLLFDFFLLFIIQAEIACYDLMTFQGHSGSGCSVSYSILLQSTLCGTYAYACTFRLSTGSASCSVEAVIFLKAVLVIFLPRAFLHEAVTLFPIVPSKLRPDLVTISSLTFFFANNRCTCFIYSTTLLI